MLEALAEKYRALAHLRRTRDSVTSFTPDELLERRAEMRRIAAAFPGALRELDALDASILEKRAATIEAVIAGATAPRWLQIVLDWHEAWRARPAGGVADVWAALGARHGLTADELRALIFQGPASGTDSQTE